MANEKRLIDVLPLMQNGWHLVKTGESNRFLKSMSLADVPTVEAVPVVHGRWEPIDHDGSWRVDKCSACHRRMHYVDYDQPYAYCPNCGAKMDGERKDNGSNI